LPENFEVSAKSMAYSGRLAIIAGGLGGLGSATAKLLHASGASLALLYAPFEASRRDAQLEAAFGNPAPSTVRTYEADITSEESVRAAFEAITKDASAQSPPSFPSILINAAGYVSVQPLTETSAEEAAKNILPNLLGPFIVSNAFFNLYTNTPAPSGSNDKPPGRIVSISSQAAHVALPNHGAYCASKAGLMGLVRSQALEWGPHGVTSNTVSPTVAMTELGRKAWADPQKKADMLAQIPVGRFAEPQEIAEAMEWLCRDSNGMLNGMDIKIDGGESLLPLCQDLVRVSK
jgi:NAD(P)-dependent dehydrogenase (short-subunit alcohol dehydrogenase family)